MATKLSIVRIPGNLIQLSWPTKSGFTYQLRKTRYLNNWENVGAPVTGDGTVKTRNQATDGLHWFYSLKIEFAQGSSPPTQAITNWDGSRVLLLWEPFGPSPTGQYQIFRNNQLLAVTDADSDAYADTAVASGQHYNYEVKFYSTA